jgi:MEMO1 family protein
MTIRKSTVSGYFYPGEPAELLKFLAEHLILKRERRLPARAIVVPHAGYLYSGALAARVYGSIQLPRRFVILCPNHTGVGAPLAIVSEGTWETPLGSARIDERLSSRLKEFCREIDESPLAHRQEHSLEVQLPFLQYLLSNDFTFVPLSVSSNSYDQLVRLGRALGELAESWEEPVLIISSSDMNHFESADVTLRKDELAICRIKELDSWGLWQTVRRHGISMCGCAPTVAAIEGARVLQCTEGILLGHMHSGQVTGENSRVVGYAGIALC